MLLLAALVLAPPKETILVVDALVIGSRTSGAWKVAAPGFGKSHRAVGFTSFGIGKVAARPDFYGFDDESPDGPTYLASERPERDRSPMLSGVAPKVPRRVQVLPPSAPYELACRRWLLAHGVKLTRARVTRVLKADLDGDGTDETIVEATNGSIAYQAPKGTYTLVLLRALRGGKVVETPLEFYPKKPGGVMLTAETRGIADLDGDGRMEIVISDSGIDEAGAALWGYRAGRATKLVENGYGV